MENIEFRYTGKILRCNRKTGELTIAIDFGLPENYSHTPWIFIEIDGGLVPFRVSSEQKRSNDILAVVLEDYEKPDIAQRFTGMKIYIPADENGTPEDDKVYFGEIIGYDVIDSVYGPVGKLNDVFDRPEQEILQVMHEGREILIPLADEIFKGIDRRKKKLFIDAPDGLIGLYLNEENE